VGKKTFLGTRNTLLATQKLTADQLITFKEENKKGIFLPNRIKIFGVIIRPNRF